MTFRFSAGAILASALFLSACDSDDDDIDPSPPPAPRLAELRIIHAVADAPTVNVGNDGINLASGLAFSEATPAIPAIAGTYTIQVDAIVPGGTVTVIPATGLPFAGDTAYTVIAAGETAGGTIAPIVLENPATPVGAGNVRVEVVHAAPNANNAEANDAVDIYVTTPDADLTGATPIAGDATPFGANSGQLEVPGGDYQIRVTAPGSTTPVFDSGTVTLPAGADLIVVAVDNTGPGSAPITLLVSDGAGSFEIHDAATPAEVRVVHAVPDAPPVDVYINDPTAIGPPAIEDLAYTEVIPGPDTYVDLTPGTTNVLVTAADNPGVVAIPATDLELEAGQQYTVYATGEFATIAPLVTLDDDRPVVTESRVRILHLAPNAGLVDIYVQAPGTDINTVEPTLEDVDFLADTGYIGLAGGNYEVSVTLADTKTVAIGPAAVTLVDGGVYTVAARDPDPGVPMDGFGVILLDDF